MRFPIRLCAHRRELAVVLLIATVYEMWACPCGCAKHNYWIRAARWWTGGQSSPSTPFSPVPVVSVNDDDCTHMPRELTDLQDKLWSSEEEWSSEFILPTETVGSSDRLTPERHRVLHVFCCSPPHVLSAQELRAVLGVFLI